MKVFNNVIEKKIQEINIQDEGVSSDDKSILRLIIKLSDDVAESIYNITNEALLKFRDNVNIYVKVLTKTSEDCDFFGYMDNGSNLRAAIISLNRYHSGWEFEIFFDS